MRSRSRPRRAAAARPRSVHERGRDDIAVPVEQGGRACIDRPPQVQTIPVVVVSCRQQADARPSSRSSHRRLDAAVLGRSRPPVLSVARQGRWRVCVIERSSVPFRYLVAAAS